MKGWRRASAGLSVLVGLAGCASGPVPHITVPEQIQQPTASSPWSPIPATGPVPVVAATQCAVIDGKADRRCTPGQINPGVYRRGSRSGSLDPSWTFRPRCTCRLGWRGSVSP